jgi:UDP-glucose 4-epimerase
LLHKIGNAPDKQYFALTSADMTRFVMTLEQSVDLIEHAIINGESGDTVIPKLISMNVKDMIELFSEKYNKPIVVTGLRSGEKLLESLINDTQSGRIIVNGDYTHIKSVIKHPNIINACAKDYNSKINPLTKEQLSDYLNKLNLI